MAMASEAASLYHYQRHQQKNTKSIRSSLIRLEPQRPALLPHLLAPNLHSHDEQVRSEADGCLDAKALFGASCLGPCDLEVADDEAPCGAGEVDPGGLAES